MKLYPKTVYIYCSLYVIEEHADPSMFGTQETAMEFSFIGTIIMWIEICSLHVLNSVVALSDSALPTNEGIFNIVIHTIYVYTLFCTFSTQYILYYVLV